MPTSPLGDPSGCVVVTFICAAPPPSRARAGVYKACNDCLQFLPAVVLSNLLQAVSVRFLPSPAPSVPDLGLIPAYNPP